jgi:divalent metal cation (Fe/Co/Zn/Cd) transporter
MKIEFTPEVISGIVGVILTLVFAYFPKLRVWYGGLASEIKSLIMLGLLAASSLTIFLLAWNGVIQTSEPVTLTTLLQVLFFAIAANQPVYRILPEAGDVVEAKANR